MQFFQMFGGDTYTRAMGRFSDYAYCNVSRCQKALPPLAQRILILTPRVKYNLGVQPTYLPCGDRNESPHNTDTKTEWVGCPSNIVYFRIMGICNMESDRNYSVKGKWRFPAADALN